ncbi:head-tail connector protein [Clostridium sp. C2-6-12]|uniref:head-tail connector protein n=1 Tax=Clostridium sp. C2-6-12 TaxID=2698832 RepID=UPI001372123C|nr:head-tail connector protein [Clostridium sp. C2-6-12]
MTLEEAKNYLRIDDTFDDNYIQSIIDTTQIYIDSCVGEAYKTDEKLVKLATLVQYKLINDLYDSKSSYVQNNMVRDRIVETIFEKLSNAGDEI